MAYVNFGGVESGTLTAFAATSGSVAVESSIVKEGTYAVRINPTTTNTGIARCRGFGTAGASANLSLADLYGGFWFRAVTLPAANSEEIANVASNKMFLRINSSGNLMAFASDGTTQIGSTGLATLVTGTWYWISFHCGTGTTAAFQVNVNDTLDISGTGNLTTSNGTQLVLGKLNDRNSQTIDVIYDSWVITNSEIPPSTLRQSSMNPTGDGAAVTWTRGGVDSGADWSQVSEVPASAAEYLISTLVANERSNVTFETSASAGISGTVLAVKPMCFMQRDGAANGTAAIGIRSGGTDSDNASNANIAAAAEAFARVDGSSFVLALDPTDSAAWTPGKLDALELCVVEKETTDRSRWNWGTVDVLWQGAVGRNLLYGQKLDRVSLVG